MGNDDFLAAVLPSTGLYCVVELSTKYKQHRYIDNLGDAQARADTFNAEGFNTYVAMASFVERGSREAANARCLRSLFFDIDISPTGKSKTGKPVYLNKRAAVGALHEFLQETGLDKLGDPWLIDSGGGVHAYWPLNADMPVAEWFPLAERLKRTAVMHKLLIDTSVTSDASRVMRMPGTFNHKFDPPKQAIIKVRGPVFDVEDIDALLPALNELGAYAPVNGNHSKAAVATLNIPGTRPIAPGTAVAAVGKALVAHVDSSFDKILQRSVAGDGCAQIKWFRENAAEDGMEPMWRAMLSLAKCTTEGEAAGREISSWHPYAEDRFQAKWNALQGPYGCSAIEELNPGGCNGCPHAGKITNPLPLGRAYAPQPIPATPTTPALPALPSGYAFDKGKLCRVVPDGENGDKLVPILPYPFFLHSVMQEESSFSARFCRIIDANNIMYVAVPMRTLASKDDAIKKVAEQNIFALYGAGNDLHLFAYMRACVQEASAGNNSLRVPPKYGWQPDNSFAFGDNVLSKSGNYTFVSDRLNNLIEGMKPQGTLAAWQRVMQVLCNKGCYDVVALSLIGLASPLMRWSNNGADAMTFHACSRASGVGKSLALSLARSAWGGKRLTVVPKTSENTMLQRAGLLGGLPLLVDEVTSKNRQSEMEWVPGFIFDYSQGQHKLKGSGSANAELNDNMTWNGLALLTSNSPVLEHMLGARDTSSNGEVQRFLEWRTEQQIDFTVSEREALEAINDNYGIVGPLLANWLVNNIDIARDLFAATMDRWRKHINASDAERFWVSGCTAIITCATLLGPGYANIFPLDVKPIAEFLHGLIANARRLIASNVTSAPDLLSGFMREHNGMFVKIGRAGGLAGSLANNGMNFTLPDTARGKVVGRIEYETTPGAVGTFIDVAALKKYCSMRNWSYVALKSDLSVDAVVLEKMQDLFKGTSMPSTPTRCLYLSYPTADAPFSTA